METRVVDGGAISTLVAFLFLASGCIQAIFGEKQQSDLCQSSTSGTIPTPSPGVLIPTYSPLYVALEVCNFQGFFKEGAGAKLIIQSPSKSRVSVVAGLALPSGVDLTSGQVSYEGPVAGGQPLELSGVLRASKPGQYVLRAWAEVNDEATSCSRAAPSASVGLRGSAKSTSAFQPSISQYDFGFELVPNSADVSRLTARAKAPFEVAAKILLVLPPPPAGLVLVEGQESWQGTLLQGETLEREYKIGFEEDGNYTVQACLYPDPKIDGLLHRDLLYFTVDGDRVTVSDGPSR